MLILHTILPTKDKYWGHIIQTRGWICGSRHPKDIQIYHQEPIFCNMAQKINIIMTQGLASFLFFTKLE